MRLILDKILWGTLIVLFGPSVMIVASWNALPGDNLYGVKLALERTALAIASPSYATAGSLQIKYTERRFAEAKQLLASKQSIQGLPYLEQQIAETRKAIESAPDKTTQVALAKQYINTLTTVSTDLETQKQSITTTISPQSPLPSEASAKEGQPTPIHPPTATPAPVTTSDVKEVPTSEVKRPTPTPTSTPPPIQIAQITTTAPIPTRQAIVALQIDQTQQDVNHTIAELQALVDKDDDDRDDRRERKKEREQDKKERNDRHQEPKKEQKEKRDNDNDR